NAMIPTLSMIGLRYGWMLGGTILVETVFDWPGIGLYAVNAAVSSDFQPIMGVTLLVGLNFMLANLLVDLAYGWLDPRVRRRRPRRGPPRPPPTSLRLARSARASAESRVSSAATVTGAPALRPARPT